MNFFQPKPVVNHPDPSVDYTRVVEYKHLPTAGSSPHTVLFYERSSDVGEPYYPVPTPKNQALYERYKAMAADEEGVVFVGRLANYKYFNMDEAIKNSLELFDTEATLFF